MSHPPSAQKLLNYWLCSLLVLVHFGHLPLSSKSHGELPPAVCWVLHWICGVLRDYNYVQWILMWLSADFNIQNLEDMKVRTRISKIIEFHRVYPYHGKRSELKSVSFDLFERKNGWAGDIALCVFQVYTLDSNPALQKGKNKFL